LQNSSPDKHVPYRSQVYGAAGNSAAVFPMRRLGAYVWPLNTVQFSNHTQYGAWEGLPTPDGQISKLVDGIAARGVLKKCDALLSGYLGSAAQGGHVLSAVASIKAANPLAVYCCDPVMGHPAKGCIVPEGVQEFFREEAVPMADIICPNVLELGVLAGMDSISSVGDCIEAARSIISRGPKIVFIKHLASAGLEPNKSFEMLLVSSEEAFHVATPIVPFERPPTGVGDLTTGIFLVKLLTGASLEEALKHTAGAYFGVMVTTSKFDEYELQLIDAQDEIANPTAQFEIKNVD